MPEERTHPNVNGIPLKSGVNDCYWNCEGHCTNPGVTRKKLPEGYSRDWDSLQNCPLTILGVILCSGFKFINERQNSAIYKLVVERRAVASE